MRCGLRGNPNPDEASGGASLEILLGLGLGLSILLAGVAWLIHQQALLERGHRVEGTIIAYARRDLNVRPGELEQPIYYPIFQFRDEAGQQHTVTSLVGGTVGVFEAPKKILIVYDPKHPERSTVATGRYLWTTPLALTIMGMGLVALAIRAFWRRRATE